MKKFSEFFELNKSQPELDFVDITPGTDVPLFIDPYSASIRSDEWSMKCNLHIRSFFQTLINYIRANHVQEAKTLLNYLHEPNETCLGLSSTNPNGRGVGGKQASDLYENLLKSQAAKTGLLSELAECDLFIEGIGRDKISDITTNIIRKLLIEYTQQQANLLGIELTEVASGFLWDSSLQKWYQDYVKLPVIEGKKIILVPKFIVRYRISLDCSQYYDHYILNFLREEHLSANSSLVHVLKNGERRVYKKELREQFPFDKEWIAQFTEKNPEVLEEFKEITKNNDLKKSDLNRTFEEDFNESVFADALISSLNKIPAGKECANTYHDLMIGILEYIFWPNLTCPNKEVKIHDGRKRIDITYTNAALHGFFYRIHNAYHISSTLIMVECKNYTKKVSAPEFDQLSGRFSVNRGKFGILVYRNTDDYTVLLQKCKDTAQDGRGFIFPLGDEQIIELLKLIADGKRPEIETYLDELLKHIIT